MQSNGGDNDTPGAVDLATRIEHLHAENLRFAGEIRRLNATERDLMESRLKLDQQVRIYRKLHELGTQLATTFDIQDITAKAIQFVIYELNFERAVFMLAPGSSESLQVSSYDGYFDDDDAARVGGLTFRLDDPMLDGLRTAELVLVPELDQPEGSAAWAKCFSVDEWVLVPLRGEGQALNGFLLAGNSRKNFSFQTRVDKNSPSILGLGTLATQVAATLNNARLYSALESERRLLEEKVKERTQELSAANENLTKLDKLKMNFFANISHELRTPLTLSIGPLDMLLKERSVPPAPERTLRTIQVNQLRLLKLINDLLDFSKLEAGKATSRFRREDLVSAVRFYLGTLEAALASRSMKLDCEAPALVEVFLDRDKFEKIFMNLLSNAFKFTPDGGSLKVRVLETADAVQVSVSDTGVGIPKDALGKLFERFSQVDSGETRRYSGTGIGLAMVRELMQFHGGDVTVDSTFGVGTTFTLHFKKGYAHLQAEFVDLDAKGASFSIRQENLGDFLSDVEELPSEEEPAADGAITTAPGERGRVLVVDDTAGLREMMAKTLRKDGFEVFTAVDGQEGLDEAIKLKPDIIVSDVMMPRLSGYDLCRAIKTAKSDLATTPVVLVTARADMAMKLDGLDRGADDYLVKPFNFDELRTRVRNLVSNRRQQQLLREMERKAVEKDLELAGAVQTMLLPPSVQKLTRFELAARYEPASLVGGDWWWSDEMTGGRLRVFVGDITGHGAGAAMISAAVASSYRTVMRSSPHADLEEVFAQLDRTIMDISKGVYGMTLAAVELDPVLGRGRLVAAAAPPPLLKSVSGEVRALTALSSPLGNGAFAIATHDFECGPGTRLLLYTDGITELAPRGRPFGFKSLKSAFAAAPLENASATLDAVSGAIDVFRNHSALEDDLTAVAVFCF